MAANWQPKPIYCPRRHGVECDTPNACAGGADCRFGPDLNARMNDRPSVSNTTMLERLNYVQSILEDAQCYLLGETPEVGTVEDAKDDLLVRIRTALLTDVPALRKPVGWYERQRS